MSTCTDLPQLVVVHPIVVMYGPLTPYSSLMFSEPDMLFVSGGSLFCLSVVALLTFSSIFFLCLVSVLLFQSLSSTFCLSFPPITSFSSLFTLTPTTFLSLFIDISVNIPFSHSQSLSVSSYEWPWAKNTCALFTARISLLWRRLLVGQFTVGYLESTYLGCEFLSAYPTV